MVSPVQIQVPLPNPQGRPGRAPYGETIWRGREKYGPLVKWLRHRPFTAVTWVRIPYGSPRQKKPDPFRFRPVERPETAHTQVPSSFSPQKLKTAFAGTPGPGAPQFGGLAQLVRALASHARGHWFESSSLHQKQEAIRKDGLLFLLWSRGREPGEIRQPLAATPPYGCLYRRSR